MIESFPILVNYTQVLAYRRNLERPGLLWTDAHVAQGFAWNPGIAAFGVPDHDGECLLEVNTDGTPSDLQIDASLWAIAVPFDTEETEVRVGTILDDQGCAIAPGSYRLVFEAHPGRTKAGTAYAYVLRFNFIRAGHADFEILKQGSLQSGTVLLTTAERG